MKTYTEFITEARENNTRRTQIKGTAGTYRKTGEFLSSRLPAGSRILSHGAGLDHTKPALIAGLGDGHEVHDFEPNPEGRTNQPEFANAKKIPSNHYDAVVSHNVLNVVEPATRREVLRSIFKSVKQGGHLVIGTRAWKGDIDKTKNFEPADEEKAMWVKKKGAVSYQKGFDGNELKDHVEDFARTHGHDVTVTRLQGIASNGVHVQVHRKKK